QGGVLRQAHDFESARPMGQAADEAALLEAADEAVDARLGFEAERLFHLLEGGRDSAIRQPAIDEDQQIILFSRQHQRSPMAESTPKSRLEQNKNLDECSSLVRPQRQAPIRTNQPSSSAMISTISPAAAAGACGARTTRQSERASSDIIELSCCG